MDTVTEDLIRADVDPEMTVLTSEDITGQNLGDSDEVEHLRNSLREAVHDDNVRPKMQCLMMDSSFSMVTMQGEDSGIAWETTPSRCATPWASEAGNPPVDLSSPVAVRPATPGSGPAGKIIFVMDEELISRRKKTKERRPQQLFLESSENISGRPELVEVSQPNVKTEREGDEEEPNDPLVDKEQQLFRLVSEGSEILNIIVPQKVASVDEEVSKEMVDNLSYLEEIPVSKPREDTHDYEMLMSPEGYGAERDVVRPLPPVVPNVMDPPGAPVARPQGRPAPGNVDYFEAFTMIDAQAPGGPAVVAQGQVVQDEEAAIESQNEAEPVASKDQTTAPTTVDTEKCDTISLGEITSDLLDEVFYGGTEDYLGKSLERGDVPSSMRSRTPSKPSGSTLFGSQEEILTPIFLPEGPAKIIDPILLEEPKAMAFLYTDLYEEAIGSRVKEEDTESLTSEKSFHSRHSDREARGYLEKYVLIDETPAVDMEAGDKENHPVEGPRILSEDFNAFSMMSKPEKGEVPASEEEITDFFRSSANSSPCDIEPFPRSLEEEETKAVPKKKDTKTKSVSIKAEKVAEFPVDPLSISSFEFPLDEPDWEGTDDHPMALDKKDVDAQDLWKKDLEVQMPVAPPRRRVPSAPKACLDLTPLTPVDLVQEKEEGVGGKEQRVEEKETASPAETADEGDGDGEEMMRPPCNDAPSENLVPAEDTQTPKSAEEGNEITVSDTSSEEKDTKTVEEEAKTQRISEEVDITASEMAASEIQPETTGDDSTSSPAESAKQGGRCIIL